MGPPPPVQHWLLPTHEFRPKIGGIGIYIEELAGAAARRGLHPRVVAPLPDGGEFPFRVDRVRMRPDQDWICRWKMWQHLRRAKDISWDSTGLILAEPGPLRLWLYQSVLKFPEIPTYILLHGSEIQRLSGKPRWRRRLGWLLEGAAGIGVVSQEVEQLFRKAFPEFQGPIDRVPGAVRQAWRDLLPNGPNLSPRRTLLQVGRIHPRKGQAFLVEAAALLPEFLRRNLRVRLVGPVSNGAYLQEILKMAGSSGIELIQDGELSEAELVGAYKDAYAAVFPSLPFRQSIEGLGLSLLEASHWGLPVVASRWGGIPEVVDDNQSGLLVDAGSAEALASALQRLLTDEGLAQQLGRGGAQKVRRTFSWERNVQKIECAFTRRSN